MDTLDVARATVCMDCDRLFGEGERYSERLTGFVGEMPVTEMVCIGCGMTAGGGEGG